MHGMLKWFYKKERKKRPNAADLGSGAIVVPLAQAVRPRHDHLPMLQSRRCLLCCMSTAKLKSCLYPSSTLGLILWLLPSQVLGRCSQWECMYYFAPWALICSVLLLHPAAPWHWLLSQQGNHNASSLLAIEETDIFVPDLGWQRCREMYSLAESVENRAWISLWNLQLVAELQDCFSPLWQP